MSFNLLKKVIKLTISSESLYRKIFEVIKGYAYFCLAQAAPNIKKVLYFLFFNSFNFLSKFKNYNYQRLNLLTTSLLKISHTICHFLTQPQYLIFQIRRFGFFSWSEILKINWSSFTIFRMIKKLILILTNWLICLYFDLFKSFLNIRYIYKKTR